MMPCDSLHDHSDSLNRQHIYRSGKDERWKSRTWTQSVHQTSFSSSSIRFCLDQRVCTSMHLKIKLFIMKNFSQFLFLPFWTIGEGQSLWSTPRVRLNVFLGKKHLSRSAAATKLNMRRETLHHPLRRSMFTLGLGTDHCGAFSSEWFSTNHKGVEKHPVHLKNNLHTTRRQKPKTSALWANYALNHSRYKNVGNISQIVEYSLWRAALINRRRAIPSNERDHSPAVNEDRR